MVALRDNLTALQLRLRSAEAAAGRSKGSVDLLPVTKAVPVGRALELARLGCGELAENRASDLEAKALAARSAGLDVRWHFIGSIQRNKARRILKEAAVLHAVDSVRLLETLERISLEEGHQPEGFLQLLLSTDSGKHGAEEGQLAELLDAWRSCRAVGLRGLMVMGSLTPGETERVFRRAGELKEELTRTHASLFVKKRCELSMGMSGDLEQAVLAGSDLVRVGSALYEGVEVRA